MGQQRLSVEVGMVADYCYEQAENAECRITAELRRIADELDGGRLTGLAERLKGMEAYRAKVAEVLREDDAGAQAGMREIQAIIERISDVIRYTVELQPEAYVAGCRQVSSALESYGHQRESCQNAWPHEESAGITTIWRTADGQPFEVQFHTPDSLAARELLHPATKKLRDRRTTERERAELREFRRTVARHVPAPPGAPEIS